jgi:hypothetical protein
MSWVNWARELMPSLANALWTWVLTVWRERCSCSATSRLVAPWAIRLMTLSSESVRLSQPVFARGWLTRCHCGQPSLPIAVTSHIDGVDGSLNDGITSHRGEPCGSSDEHTYVAPDLFTAETPLGSYQGMTGQVVTSRTKESYRTVLAPRGSSKPQWLEP